jgi:hypothetical protein
MLPRLALTAMVIVMHIGCAPTVPTGTLSGKVTFKGTIVPEGCLISFVADSGYAALGTVDAKGEYKLVMAGKQNIPAAKYRIAVTVPGINGPEMTDDDERKFMAGDPATVAKFTQKQQKITIPERYSDTSRSGLGFEIKPGTNTYDIELK